MYSSYFITDHQVFLKSNFGNIFALKIFCMELRFNFLGLLYLLLIININGM